MENNNCCQSNGAKTSTSTQSRTRRPSHRRDLFADTPFAFGVTASDVGQMFDRLFDLDRNSDSSLPNDNKPAAAWRPGATIWEDKNGFHVELDLPGVSDDDLEVTMEAGRLVIQAKRVMPEVAPETPERKVLHNERRFGDVARSVELPESIDADSIEASLENGVLTVSLKKRPEVLPRKIAVTRKG